MLLAVALVSLAGCKDIREEKSVVMKQQGKVCQRLYEAPYSYEHTWTTYTHQRIGKVTFTTPHQHSETIHVPAKYGVVFQCMTGAMTVKGPDLLDRQLWEQLKEEQDVIVSYQEVYENEYAKDKKINSHLVRYDFVGAVPGILDPESPK